MKRRYGCRLKLLIGILAVFMLCGCGNADGAENGNGGDESAGGGNAGTSGGRETEGDVQNSENTPSSEEAATDPIFFEGKDMDGNTVTSDIFAQSRLTMVNVWATYCNPCLREMPELGELAGEYDSADFQLFGIISDVQEGAEEEKLNKAAGLIEQTGADYPHLLLNESLYYALLTDVSGVPTTFFIDENGVVLGAVVGAKEKSVWKEIIDGLLDAL